MISIYIVNGPNLASIGVREPDIYGSVSLHELQIKKKFEKIAENEICDFMFFQSDSEGSIVEAIHSASSDALVINPGAYSHTSVAILDAMRNFKGPVVEVHISQIHKREPYRHRMLTAQVADALISGAGINGYLLAVRIVLDLIRR